MPTSAPAASVSVDRVASAFNRWAESDPIDGLDTYYWWCRDVRVDPDEIIASDGRGTTYRVPFTTDGDHEVDFGEPVEVRQTYVDVSAPSAAHSSAAARSRQQILASDLPRPQRAPRNQHDHNPAASRPEPEETPMDDNVRQALARQHGLDPESATEDQVNAAVIAAAEANAPATEPNEPPEPTEPVADGTPSEPEAEPVTPPAETQEVVLTAAQYRELQEGAAAGRAAQAELSRRDTATREESRVATREQVLQAAVRDGRLHHTDVATYRDAYDQSPERTTERLQALSPGVIPALERVDLPQPGTPGASKAGADALLTATLARHGVAGQES